MAVTVQPAFYQTWSFSVLSGGAGLALVALAVRYRIRQFRWAQAAQHAFSRQLIASQERERRRIAAEPHDSLGQHLLIIKNRAAMGEAVTTLDTPARMQFDEITTSAAFALEEVRQIAHDLRPVHLEILGLTAVLEDMVERVAGAAGLSITTDIKPLDAAVGPDAAITLYRIVQECLSNIVRHANATRASVEASVDGETVNVTVRDNGTGFLLGEVRDAGPRPTGLGLSSIAERAQMMGAAHTITSAPGRGTTVSISIPTASSRVARSR